MPPSSELTVVKYPNLLSKPPNVGICVNTNISVTSPGGGGGWEGVRFREGTRTSENVLQFRVLLRIFYVVKSFSVMKRYISAHLGLKKPKSFFI